MMSLSFVYSIVYC